jgi:hypothetical protein
VILFLIKKIGFYWGFFKGRWMLEDGCWKMDFGRWMKKIDKCSKFCSLRAKGL